MEKTNGIVAKTLEYGKPRTLTGEKTSGKVAAVLGASGIQGEVEAMLHVQLLGLVNPPCQAGLQQVCDLTTPVFRLYNIWCALQARRSSKC